MEVYSGFSGESLGERTAGEMASAGRSPRSTEFELHLPAGDRCNLGVVREIVSGA